MNKYFMILAGLIMSMNLVADDFDSFDDFGDSEESKPPFSLKINGSVGYENRINFQDGYKKDLPFGNIKTKFESDYLDIVGDFTLDKYDNRIKTQELYTRFYLGDKVQLELGRQKLIWGKGDKVHLVNNINATDYRDFINGDYRDKLIGEDMIRLVYLPFYDSEAQLEFVYTPKARMNKYATDGVWQPHDLKMLDDSLSKLGKSSGDFTPKSKTFKDDQFGLRFTNTDSNNGIDYGFSYYHGMEKDPTIDKKTLMLAQAKNPNAIKKIMSGNLDVHYDQEDIFGLEASKVIFGGINARFETAYYLTKDVKGEDPNIKNNRIGTLIGGDRSMSDYGWHNINLNLQLQTIYTLQQDKIKENQMMGQNYDNDFDSKNHYVKNTAIFKIEDKFKNDTIIPSIKIVWNVEDQDYAIMPEIQYIYKVNLLTTIGYNIYDGGEGTKIGQFRKNDYGYLKIEYKF